MAKSRLGGLGKGLDSLIRDELNIDSGSGNVREVVKEVKVEVPVESVLKITQIEPNRKQPRKQFDETALNELADSIKQYGIVQPLVVQKRDDYYEIVAGERRWRAAKLAGLKEVPVIIKDYTDGEIAEIALIENIQREDLNPIEEALAYKRLIDEFNLRQEDVADKVSKSRASITNSLRLLKLDEKIQNYLIDGVLTMGHAKVLLSVDDRKLQIQAADKIIQENLSVRDTEKLIKGQLEEKSKKPKEKAKSIKNNAEVYSNIENRLKELMGTKVKIQRKDDKKGKIEIEYYSPEELERIIEYLGINW